MNIPGKIITDETDKSRPETVGRKLALLYAFVLPGRDRHYREACAWYGALSVADMLGDHKLLKRLVRRYKTFHPRNKTLLAGDGHVDENVFGIVPLEISVLTKHHKYIKDGIELAEHQYKNIKKQIRYAIDDMFMITGLQVQAYRASGDGKYLELAAETMADYLEHLQQPDGLFFHHKDFTHKWGRGNGWVASGMAELISELSETSKYYKNIIKGYKLMMSGLLKYQIHSGRDKGLWKQIVDSEDPRNWAETSGSAMFCYAMITGLSKGILPESEYLEAVKKTWKALNDKLDIFGRLKCISKWAYKPDSHPESGKKYDNDEENYYFDRKRLTGDYHGQAPMLWCAAALMKRQ